MNPSIVLVRKSVVNVLADICFILDKFDLINGKKKKKNKGKIGRNKQEMGKRQKEGDIRLS